ncbi:hypothetical protein ABZ801_17570 [Actinomadura sp. NPDC047616]|uniref:hypothetical protein n=1 Tax=Actinomadura sp. NPDC047616 TaxID=3155914 RepID=UPI0033C2BE87
MTSEFSNTGRSMSNLNNATGYISDGISTQLIAMEAQSLPARSAFWTRPVGERGIAGKEHTMRTEARPTRRRLVRVRGRDRRGYGSERATGRTA